MKKIIICSCIGVLPVLGFAAQHSINDLDGSMIYAAPVCEYVSSHWGNGTSQGGMLWGGSIGYLYAKRDGLFCNVEFQGAAGTWHGSAGRDPTQEYITQAKVGYVVTTTRDSFTVTPSIGIGSYVFNQTLASSHNFHSYFWFIPIGLRLDWRVHNHWVITLAGTGAPTFSGSYKVQSRDKAPTTALWEGSLPIQYIGGMPFSVAIAPFIKYWGYRHRGELIRQVNTYVGLQMTLGYRF